MSTIGSKRKRVRLETPVFIADTHGGRRIASYTLRAQIWAHERPLNGKEALLAAQVTAVLSSVWEIWFRDANAVPPEISVLDRLVFGARTVQIEAFVDPSDTRDELYLSCSEVQA